MNAVMCLRTHIFCFMFFEKFLCNVTKTSAGSDPHSLGYI